MIRVVIDTNVVVSAMISREGNEALIVLAISQGLVVPYVSAEILGEYSGVLQRERFGFSRDEVEAMLGLFQRHVFCWRRLLLPICLLILMTISS